jgi:hypothetical protein
MWRLPPGANVRLVRLSNGALMPKHSTSSCALCLALLLATSSQALGATKHFRLSCEHFRAYANNAAEIYFKVEHPAERNILVHLSVISNIYAEKNNSVMNMTNIFEHMASKRDRIFVQERLHEAKREILSTLPQDIKLLTDLIESQENQDLRTLGNQVINEMRVFERNTDNL